MGIRDRGGEFAEEFDAFLESVEQFLIGLFKGGNVGEYLLFYFSAQGLTP